MQAQPIDSITSSPSTEAPESRTSTTQDGFHPPAPGVFDGNAQPRLRSVSPSSVAAGATPLANGSRAGQLDDHETSCRLSGQEERAPLPGERIIAYENAATPSMPPTVGFKVVKRSGSPSDGPSLADCPNGTLSFSHLMVGHCD